MRSVDDLATDIASIVSSCRPGELMTIKKIDDAYRALYNCSIPYCDYGFSSVEKLLESFPTYFKFSKAEGMLIVRTGMRNNITDLIAKERKSKKGSKNFVTQNNQPSSLVKKHKRKEMKVEPQLPLLTLQNIEKILEQSKKPINKDQFLNVFLEKCGYELKYMDYGYLDYDNMLNSLNGVSLKYKNNLIYPMVTTRKTFADYLKRILSSNTGFTISSIQEYICAISQEKIADMMKLEGFVNFIDVIYNAATSQVLSYDFDWVYPYTTRIAKQYALYPPGVCQIKFIHINTPADFLFKVISNPYQPAVAYIDEQMQEMSSQMKLLSMFKENKICAVEYDGYWYRVKIDSLQRQKNTDFLSLQFIDHDIESETGIQISLPTDRLRFLPPELELIPAFIYRGSLAYVKPLTGGPKWTKETCARFRELAINDSWNYQAFLYSQIDDDVCIDVVALTEDGERISLFHVLGREKMVKVEL